MVIGLDIGYGFTKVTDGAREICFASVVGKAERIRYRSDLAREDGAGSGMVLITEEGECFVGELALLQSRLRWTLLDRSRVGERSARLLAIAALCAVTDPDGEAKLDLVTGLPVSWYGDKEVLTSALQGRHVVRYRIGEKERIARLDVGRVLVVPQPFGSLFSRIIDDEGVLVDEELAGGRVGVIDIGTYTTDYILVDRLRYVERGSGSIPSGLSQAYRLLAQAIEDRWGLTLALHEVDRVVRDGAVRVFGMQEPIADLTKPIFSALAEEVLAEAISLWGDGRDLDAVLVTGGGAAVIGDRVARRFPHAQLLGDPAMANVRGFWRYGQRKFGAEEG